MALYYAIGSRLWSGGSLVKVIVRVAFSVQLIWYGLFLTGLLERWTAGNEAVFDGVTIVTAFYGIIIANAYILMNKRLDRLSVIVVLVSFSILALWLYTVYIAG